MTSNTNLTVTGVDFGSSAVKIAAVLKGGVEIIVNEANFRQTPNVVGMGQKERLMGQLGQLKIKSNHSNTVLAPTRYLGFDSVCPYLTEQLKLCPARAQKPQTPSDYLRFNLLQGEQRQLFTTQQLVASYITEIERIIAQTNNLQNKNMVIAVPTYFTQHQRMALMDAVEIAKKKVNNQYSTQLISEEIAISMDYGHSKRMEFSEELQDAKKVLFIDFGHSKTTLFLTAFNKQHFRILASNYHRQLGCKFMDAEILKFYANKFDSEHPNMQLNLLESKKAVMKLMENIEKQRKVLSGNYQHDLSIECLLEDEDLYHSMKRKEYEKLCQPVIQQFRKLLQSFYEQLKMKGINFDSIELIGGGTRIPAIINAISQVFELEPSRTVNSSQCVAKGAALISAMNSSIYRVPPYSYFTTSPYTIQLKVNGQNFGQNLIDKNELLLKEKSIQIEVLKQLKKFTLLAEYQEGSIETGLERRIFQCEVELKQTISQKQEETSDMKEESDEYRRLNISISIDQNGLIILDKISSPDCQTKMSKVNYFTKYSQAQLSQMQQKQKQMTLRDIKIKRFYQKKNQYESIIYKSKHSIDEIVNENREYISQTAIKEIKSFIENEENWLLSGLENNADLKMEDFAMRQNVMNQKVEQILNSINTLKQSHQLVNSELQKLANLINEIISKRTQDLYPQDVNHAGEWINEVFQKQKNSPKCNPPVVSAQQIRAVHQDLINKLHQLDQQMERQRLMNSRRYKPVNQRYQPSGTTFRPSQTYNPQSGGRSFGQYDDSYQRPKKGNRSDYNKPDPFGSFFGGSGFF